VATVGVKWSPLLDVPNVWVGQRGSIEWGMCPERAVNAIDILFNIKKQEKPFSACYLPFAV